MAWDTNGNLFVSYLDNGAARQTGATSGLARKQQRRRPVSPFLGKTTCGRLPWARPPRARSRSLTRAQTTPRSFQRSAPPSKQRRRVSPPSARTMSQSRGPNGGPYAITFQNTLGYCSATLTRRYGPYRRSVALTHTVTGGQDIWPSEINPKLPWADNWCGWFGTMEPNFEPRRARHWNRHRRKSALLAGANRSPARIRVGGKFRQHLRLTPPAK